MQKKSVVLIPLNGIGKDRTGVSEFLALAKKWNCHVIGEYVRHDPEDVLVYLGMDPSNRDAIEGDLKSRVNKEGRAAATRAMRDFRSLCKANGIFSKKQAQSFLGSTFECKQILGEPSNILPESAKLADIVVFCGEHESFNSLFANHLELTLVQSGRPILFLPDAGGIREFDNIAILWNGSSASVRALACSDRFLQNANSVRILSAGASKTQIADPNEVVQFLAHKGVKAVAENLSAEEQDVGSVLLEECYRTETNLIVMGGYGHRRVPEVLLGGTTRQILKRSTIPTLLMH